MSDETLLIMSTIGVTLYSARGLTQSLVPVAESKPQPRYTVNGELRFLGASQLRKYESVITCTDQESPAFAGLWAGMTVVVDCVAELSYLTAGGSPERTVVPGSSRVVGLHTIYRPRIQFMVTDWDESLAEYQRDYQWRLMMREK